MGNHSQPFPSPNSVVIAGCNACHLIYQSCLGRRHRTYTLHYLGTMLIINIRRPAWDAHGATDGARTELGQGPTRSGESGFETADTRGIIDDSVFWARVGAAPVAGEVR